MDTIDYIFQFNQRGDAQGDGIVGPYFVPNSGLSSDILIYDRSVDSATPLQGYWVMITSAGPLNGLFISHPNIEIVINRASFWANLPNVLINYIGSAAANLAMTISGVGVYVVSGLMEVSGAPTNRPTPPGKTPKNGYISENAVQFYISENSSSYYVTET